MPDAKQKDGRRASGPEKPTAYDISPLFALSGPELISRFVEIMSAAERQPGKQSWMSPVLPHLTMLSTAPATAEKGPSVLFRLEVRYVHSNAIGNMMGGAVSTVFDFCTTLALALVSRPGRWVWLGVTRSLNVTMLRPVPVGTVVLVEGEVVGAGQNLAHLKGRMRRESDGMLLAICEHDKVNTDPPVSATKPPASKI